jgi:hypothetical protein
MTVTGSELVLHQEALFFAWHPSCFDRRHRISPAFLDCAPLASFGGSVHEDAG